MWCPFLNKKKSILRTPLKLRFVELHAIASLQQLSPHFQAIVWQITWLDLRVGRSSPPALWFLELCWSCFHWNPTHSLQVKSTPRSDLNIGWSSSTPTAVSFTAMIWAITSSTVFAVVKLDNDARHSRRGIANAFIFKSHIFLKPFNVNSKYWFVQSKHLHVGR